MGFNLLAFAGGAASAFTEEIDKAEKEAKTYGLAKAKVLYERYSEVEKENKTLESEARKDIDMLRAKYTGTAAFSDDQLVALASKPEIRKALLEAAQKDYFDPSVLNPAQLVKLKEANPATGTLTERISKMYELPKMMEEKVRTLTPEQKQKLGFFGGIEYKAERAAMERYGVAAGVPIGQMEAALKASKEVKPEMAEFNLTGLGKKPDDYAKIKDKAQVAFVQAQKEGDPEKIKAATIDLAFVEAAERSKEVKDKSENQIQTELINKIQAEPDPKKKALLESQLRTRQRLEKLPTPAGGEEAKVTATNVITLGRTIVAQAQTSSLSYGDFDKDPEGNIFLTKPDKAAQFRQGTLAGREAARLFFSDPKTGLPKNELAKMGMAAAGLRFDSAGKAFVPPVEEIAKPPTSAAPSATAKPAITPASAPPAPAVAKTTAQLRREASEAIAKGKDPKAVAKVFKEATGEDL